MKFTLLFIFSFFSFLFFFNQFSFSLSRTIKLSLSFSALAPSTHPFLEIQLNTSEGFFVQPIGHIHSCYRQCVGTPRQVNVADFKDYIKDTKKIKNFEEKIVTYLGCILTSNEKELFYFGDCPNISKFSIFAFDIEFNEQFDPVVYEGNFYFVRRIFHPKYGVMMQQLHEDIFYEMGLGTKENIGFFDL